jgi:hypothetical protein
VPEHAAADDEQHDVEPAILDGTSGSGEITDKAAKAVYEAKVYVQAVRANFFRRIWFVARTRSNLARTSGAAVSRVVMTNLMSQR